MRLRRVLALVFLGSLVPLCPLRAQAGASDRVANVALNAAIGVARASLAARAAKRDLKTAVVRGVSGGAIAGAARQWNGATTRGASGLLARTVAAAGQSLVLSAASDTFRLWLPLTPLLLEVVPQASANRVRARLNLAQTALVIAGATRPGYRFDAKSSLAVGTPVFRTGASFTRAEGQTEGEVTYGVVRLARGELLTADADHRRLAHEGVHVLQGDQADLLIGLPLERALLRRWLPGWRRIANHVDLGVGGGAALWLTGRAYSYRANPLEQEAFRFATVGGERDPTSSEY